MGALLVTILRVGAVWLGRIGLAAFAVNELKKLSGDQTAIMEEHSNAAAASGLPAEEQRKLIAATTYEQVEKAGKSPDDFWNGLTDEEKGMLKYSPDTVRSSMERTSFLGLAQTIFWMAAAAAAGYAAFRGIPIVSKGLGQLAAARLRGAGATELLTYIEQTKMGILKNVWVPGTTATIAAGGGWLTGAMANNMNDAFLWGPTFLDQAAQDVEKAYRAKFGGTGGSGGDFTSGERPRTIIRMVEDKKPKQFLGTLFSVKLGKIEQFDRKLDDEITDKEDLEADVKLNVQKWLKTLPGRLGASISIRKEPVDEFGAKQSGIWATATLFIQQLSGEILPVDTILLGPVDPVMELELLRSTKTIEFQMPDILTAEEVREIELPNGAVDIFNTKGERVFPSGETTPAPTMAPEDNFDTSKAIVVTGAAEFEKYKAMGWDTRPNPGKPGTAIAVPPKTASTPAPAPAPKPAPVNAGIVSALASAGTLRKGSKGEAVKELQVLLNNWGEDLVVDGDFGIRTDAAVGRFQYKNGLVSDGIVGPLTKAKLFELGT